MSYPDPGQRTVARCAEWLAGQVSRDTPRPPHATAREYASKGSYRDSLRNPRTTLRWQGTDRPSQLSSLTTRPRPLVRPRGAVWRPFRADLPDSPDDLTNDSGNEFGERVVARW